MTYFINRINGQWTKFDFIFFKVEVIFFFLPKSSMGFGKKKVGVLEGRREGGKKFKKITVERTCTS